MTVRTGFMHNCIFYLVLHEIQYLMILLLIRMPAKARAQQSMKIIHLGKTAC
jgi:hypothetical protein